MSEIIKDGSTFVGYEYKEIITNAEKVSFLMDAYENFGWIIDKNVSHNSTASSSNPHANVLLRLKRDRKIMNKMELTRLQRNFEFCMKDIEQMEKSKTAKATMYSLMVGIAGTAFMAGSVFAVTADTPRVILCVILALPGFAGWLLPIFLYKKVIREQAEKVNPLIEEKKDEIYELCEKGSKLLH
jgi:hypothetical protein